MILPSFFAPASFTRLYAKYRAQRFSMLDLGRGNHAVRKAKRWFPECSYTGIDRERYNNDDHDFDLMDLFHQIDLEDATALSVLPDASYDVLIMSHVLEHLKQGHAALEALFDKVKAGGSAYL